MAVIKLLIIATSLLINHGAALPVAVNLTPMLNIRPLWTRADDFEDDDHSYLDGCFTPACAPGAGLVINTFLGFLFLIAVLLGVLLLVALLVSLWSALWQIVDCCSVMMEDRRQPAGTPRGTRPYPVDVTEYQTVRPPAYRARDQVGIELQDMSARRPARTRSGLSDVCPEVLNDPPPAYCEGRQTLARDSV